MRIERFAAVALLLAATPALGQETRSANAEAGPATAPPEARAVDQLVTAARLADWGRRNGDSQALIVAARIIGEIPLRPDTIEGRSEGGQPSERADPGQPSIQGLLDRARTLADGDGDTLDQIDAARAAAARGVVNSAFGRGPIYAVRDIEAQATYWFRLDARGGEVLRVAAVGDGDTDIDMIIRDEFGEEVCRDTAYDHYPVCTFVPAFSGRFRVDIINRGRVWTRTQILSN
ncbi:hypothetical protein [Brevundimonas sp.]|uniref:hypothetical protein n=1 Tax=Brevundimonas sp. TaxID=1871086 RepID=UPI0025CDF091|nr:hypothetical protein [Brevundimonas sp.]